MDTWEEFETFFTPKNAEQPEIHGGFAQSHWCGGRECEERIQAIKTTIRCIPLDAIEERGACVVCGKPSDRRVLCAKSY